MGLLLLIPGLLFLVNGTEWFGGEDSIGVLLTVLGAVLLVLQVAWVAFVAAKVNKEFKETRNQFDINQFRRW
jgi:hypothetical protein